MANDGKAPSGPHAEPQGTVSRGAYFGGLLVGGLIALAGLSVVPMLGLPSLAKIALEIVMVWGGIEITTRIWKKSAAESLELDARDPTREPGHTSDEKPEGGRG